MRLAEYLIVVAFMAVLVDGIILIYKLRPR